MVSGDKISNKSTNAHAQANENGHDNNAVIYIHTKWICLYSKIMDLAMKNQLVSRTNQTHPTQVQANMFCISRKREKCDTVWIKGQMVSHSTT